MKVALVHDHLTQEGGAEKVLETLLEIYPQAPVFALVHHEKCNFNLPTKIQTSFLQKFPFSRTKLPWYLSLMPTATEHHDFSNFDVVISSSSIFAKGVLCLPDTLHICYCHTPPRFLWHDSHSYIQEFRTNRLVKKLLPPVLTRLRQWDRLAASRVNHFIANSHEVQKRIAHFYNRKSTVIHPPAETSKFFISKNIGNYFLAGGRLVNYKRFDLLVQTFNHLGLSLKIFGTGPELDSLKKRARPNINFLDKVSEKQKTHLYSKCLAFLNPQHEDFGITALEAMASGRPVIAYRAGGALETVKAKITGHFFDEQYWEELADVILRFEPENFDAQQIKEHAEQWNKEIFKQKINDFVAARWEESMSK